MRRTKSRRQRARKAATPRRKSRKSKLTRKQARRMTPPLFLRDADNGERSIIDLDDETRTVRAQNTGRITVYLKLAPGLRVRVGSRCVAKRRYTELRIEPVGHDVPAMAARAISKSATTIPGGAFREIIREEIK